MNEYSINTNYIDIIAGTSNRVSTAYTEASKDIAEGNDKSIKYLKNFLTSIENLSQKSGTKDVAITASKGSLKDFSGYDNIKTAIDFLRKNIGNVPILSNLISIHDSIISYQPQYTDGYRTKTKLVTLEYECAVYMLISGLVEAMCNNIQFAQNGTKIVIKKKSESTHGTMADVISSLAKELNNKSHKEYLDAMNKGSDNKPINTSTDTPTSKPAKKKLEKELKEYAISVIDNGMDGYSIDVFKEKYNDEKLENIFEIVESFSTFISGDFSFYENMDIIHYDINGKDVITESVAYMENIVSDTLALIDTAVGAVGKTISLAGTVIKAVKNSIFGIVPLIRTILFLRYKKKADKINALEDQINYIKMNIEQLENRKGDMDENKKAEIIKRQQAIIEEYNKKAEKLRAQLMEEEKDAATAVKAENPSISKSDDEFVLEGKTIFEIYKEVE